MSSLTCRVVSRLASRRAPLLRLSSWQSYSQYSKGCPAEGRGVRRLLTIDVSPCAVANRHQSTIKDSKIFAYLSDCSATEVLRSATVSIHDYTGLPWWVTVVVITATLRTFITFPLAIYQSYVVAKIENISKLDMPEIAREVKNQIALRERTEQWTERRAALQYKIELKKRWDDLIVKNNCHPFKSTVTMWIQIPTWIFFSAALRNLVYMLPVEDAAAQLAYIQLSVGGFLWIPNLTQPDGSLILPIVLGLSNLAIIEMQTLRRATDPTRFQRYVTNFFRTFSVALIPISATVPSILCLYWTTSSLLGLAQNFVLMSNRLKIFCRIPDTPSTPDHPYRQFLVDVKEKTLKMRKKE